MISTAEALENALAPAAEVPKATEKASGAKPARNVAPKKDKSGKKATPAKKAAKAAKKGEGARQGADESHGLAAAFRARIPVRDRLQEDGSSRCLHQGRRRRADLLRQSLTIRSFVSHAPPG